LSLDRVVFVPSGRPPHRLEDASLADPVDRLEMVRRATANNPAFQLWSGEITKTTINYTIESLEYLTEAESSTPSYLIMGADTLATVPNWHRSEDLMSRCVFVSGQRPDFSKFSYPDMQIHWLEMPQIEISATRIRARVAAGQSLRYWVPEAVGRYIQDNGLYSPTEKGSDGTRL
jgi:nicotinate-nucleotide adenylyltransferase